MPSIFVAAGSPRLQFEDTQHICCGNGGQSPEFPVFGAFRYIQHAVWRAARRHKSLKLKAFTAQCPRSGEGVEEPQKKYFYFGLTRLQRRKIRVQSRLLSITRCYSCLFFAALNRSNSHLQTGACQPRQAGDKRLDLQGKRAAGRASGAPMQKPGRKAGFATFIVLVYG